MNNNSDNNKRIARNTLMLYFRMLITLIVGLFTSRIILSALGVEDFGIYNLVGGFVAMFNIIRSGLVSATQRFITYDLGKADMKELRETFSTCVIIYLAISVLTVIIAESIGPWFIENKLVIPVERYNAAIWTFQLSLVMLVVSLISFPYNSLIISHERMTAFAYISIYEVIAKLALTYILYISPFDKLIVYSALMCLVQISIPIIYMIYCWRNFNESKIQWKINWKKVKDIYEFTGWSMLGGIASVGLTQGLNVLLGMFFSPVVNAARGIAVQVQGIIHSFVGSFQMAIDPQIVKSYARGETKYMQQLVFSSSKYSYYMLFLISLPVMIEADILLSLWLIDVPNNSALFLRLIIITTIFDAFSNPFAKAIHAIGNIRKYQLVYSTLLLAIVPISYIFLKLGFPAYVVFLIHIIIGFFATISRIIIAARGAKLNLTDFVKTVLYPVIIVSLLSLLTIFCAKSIFPKGLLGLLLISLVALIVVVLNVFVFGINKSERLFIINKIKLLINFSIWKT